MSEQTITTPTEITSESSTVVSEPTQSEGETGTKEMSVEEFLQSQYGENTDDGGETNDKPASDDGNGESTESEGEDAPEEDVPISFTTEEETESVDPIGAIKQLIGDNDAAAQALDQLTTQIESERTGFSKLHEQVTTVKQIAGVESLQEVVSHYQEFMLPQIEILTSLSSDDQGERDASVKAMLSMISTRTGLSVDQLADIGEGVSSPEIKPNAAPTKEEALAVLGLTKDQLDTYQMLAKQTAFVEKYGNAIKKTSDQVGFTIDPAKLFQVKAKNPELSDEAALMAAHPNEYKQYLISKGSKIAKKASVTEKAPTVNTNFATAKGGTYSEMTDADKLAMITKSF